MGFLEKKMTLEEAEVEKERLQILAEIAERKALIAEAKKRYGVDWKKFIPGFGGGNTVRSGIDWQALKFRIGRE